MVIYKRYIIDGRSRYSKDKVQLKASRVPQPIKDILEKQETYEYDDQPDKPRCLFDEAPADHKRLVQQVLVPLCNYCYYNRTIGVITHQLDINKKEEDDGRKRRGEIPNKRKRKRTVRVG